MASDYGDEAGGKLLDWMLRIGQEAGAEAMGRSARELSERLAGIRGTIAGGHAEAIAADGVPAYAKLSLEELSGLPEYATIKEVVSDKLRAASVEHHIIPGEDRDWLLFKVEDAPEVDEAFRQLEQETGKAADRARERLAEIAERRRGPIARDSAGTAALARSRGPRDEVAGGGRAGRSGVRRGRLRGRSRRGVGREPDPRPQGRNGGDPRGASRGTSLLSGGASPVRWDRLLVRRVPRLGALPGIQRRPARRRGARKLQVGLAEGHRALRGRQGPRQQHHPHGQRAHPPREPQVRPLHRHQRQRARGGRTRHRQDALLRQAEPSAGQRELLRDRPEGHAHPRDGRRAGGARL